MVRYNEVKTSLRLKCGILHDIGLEHDMLNWVKANRKKMNAGDMKKEKVTAFKELLELCEQYKRKNQYE